MRVLVCGGRDFTDGTSVRVQLATLYDEHGDNLVVMHGGATGADSLADHWCHSKGVCQMVFRAAWHRYDFRAGPIRNQWMLDHGKPDLVLAFPGGRGTADMVRRARAAGVNVVEVPRG